MLEFVSWVNYQKGFYIILISLKIKTNSHPLMFHLLRRLFVFLEELTEVAVRFLNFEIVLGPGENDLPGVEDQCG